MMIPPKFMYQSWHFSFVSNSLGCFCNDTIYVWLNILHTLQNHALKITRLKGKLQLECTTKNLCYLVPECQQNNNNSNKNSKQFKRDVKPLIIGEIVLKIQDLALKMVKVILWYLRKFESAELQRHVKIKGREALLGKNMWPKGVWNEWVSSTIMHLSWITAHCIQVIFFFFYIRKC